MTPARLRRGRVPLLLLPVRIETRFADSAGEGKGGSELWVRVYPDQITVNGHHPELTAGRARRGQRLLGRWCGGPGNPPPTRTRRRHRGAAWPARYGAPRAAWIARQTTPLNIAQRPAAPTPPGGTPSPAAAAAEPAARRQLVGLRPPWPRCCRRPGPWCWKRHVTGELHRLAGHAQPRGLAVRRRPVAGLRVPRRAAGRRGDALAGRLRRRRRRRDGAADSDHPGRAAGRLRPGPGATGCAGAGGRLRRRRRRPAERAPLLRRAHLRAPGLADQEHQRTRRPGTRETTRATPISFAVELGPAADRRPDCGRAGRGRAARRPGGDLRPRPVRRPARHARRPGHGHRAVAGHPRLLPGPAGRRRADRGASSSRPGP